MSRQLRVLVLGVRTSPEEFLRRTISGLATAGIDVRSAQRIGELRGLGPRSDIIHIQWNSAAIDALSSRAVWKHPVVISCRGTQIRIRPHVTPGYTEKLRETFDRATAVHCVCEAIRDEAVALGLDPAKAVVIYPAVDTREFTPATDGRREGPLRMLSVGALIWTKGPEYALLTLRRLLDDGVPAHLEMIGEGNERRRALFTLCDLGLEAHVTLRGAVAPAEVRLAMQQCDVFLHSSLSEGISNAVLEAMACGVPVVTSDCGGMREAVRDGHDGFVVAVRDASAAALAVERLARDAGLRERMGRNARATVEQRFRLDDQIERFVSLYEHAAASYLSA
jgi:glycosyltransferase involved in cell wall biosynthesis